MPSVRMNPPEEKQVPQPPQVLLRVCDIAKNL